MRTLIKGGNVITMDSSLGDMPAADVLIENGRIVAVGRAIDAGDAAVIDASRMIVLPGFINGHLHTWQTALRGLAADWTVAEYMQAMHRGLATVFRPEDIHIANLMGALNQMNNGVTTLVDWSHNNPTPAHTDGAVKGLHDAGIRALFLHGSPKPNPRPGQKHFSEIPMPRSEIERLRKGAFASRDALVTLGLAILGPYYSIYDVTCEDIRLADEFDLIASMHVGGGMSKVPQGFERLLADKLVSEHVSIVHGNDIAPDTVRALVDEGATFTVTSEVELQMGYGDPLTGILHDKGAAISIGTDVEPSVGSDLFTCMRLTLQHERNRGIVEALARTGSRPPKEAITTRDALRWVTIDAARVAGLDDRVGSLTPGKQADVLLMRADDINMVPAHDTVGAVVSQGSIANVDTVLIAGKAVKKDGKLLRPGLSAEMAALKASGERILADFAGLGRRPV